MKCSKCNNELTIDTSKVLTSNPPQYACYCDVCKSIEYIDCNNYRSYLWSTKTYSADGNLIEKTVDEINKNNDKTNGWICPLCGKVFSPAVSECPYCNNKKQSNNITYSNGWYGIYPPDTSLR